jgi:serine/threonine protein phosphatase PrpC
MLSDAKAEPPPGVTDDLKQSLARKLRMAAKDANMRIFREARENLTRSGMGTTMTAVHLWTGWALIAQVGDSRAYVWRKSGFVQVTRDQSLVNQLLESGHITEEQAKFFEHSNVILQALGVQEEVEVQLSRVELRRGDRVLVCSDGLVGVVTDEEIGTVMGSIDDPEECTRILCEMANAAGGPDNITCVVAHLDGDSLPEDKGDEPRLKYELWKIEPDPPPPVEEPAPAPRSLDEDSVPPTPMPVAEERLIVEEEEPPPQNGTFELVSMAVVVGLIAGSVATGAALYRQAVPCRLEARAPGLSVMNDGRDTGLRTVEGPLELRLKPGRHTLALAGPGAPAESQDVEVVRGAECAVRIPAHEPPSEK